MDEPTAALGVSQTTMVIEPDQATRLAGRVACSSISHNLNDVFAVADRIAVLYLGQHGRSKGPVTDFDPSTVVDYMTTGAVANAWTSTRSHARPDRRADA